MTLKYVPKISVNEVYNLLPIEYRVDTKPTDITELDDTSNEELVRKRYYKFKTTHNESIHLTYGVNLDNQFNNSKAFYKVIPMFACKPLFLNKGNEYCLFGQEFFEGKVIDKLYNDLEVGESKVTKILEEIQNILLNLEEPSSIESAKTEFNNLYYKLLKYNIFSESILNGIFNLLSSRNEHPNCSIYFF